MTKYFVALLLLLLTMNSFGQIRSYSEVPNSVLNNLDKMGTDLSPYLNEYESAYVEFISMDSSKLFSFEGKKIGFIQGRVQSNKMEYFNEVKERYNRNSTPIGGTSLHVFTADQKSQSGGYDAVIHFWSKFVASNEELIEVLKSK